MTTWIDRLTALKACPPGLKKAKRFETFQELWDSLERGDWMMWALVHGVDVDEEKFVACARECLGLTEADVLKMTDLKALATVATAVYEHAPLEEKMRTWKLLADVVRSHFPAPPELPE